MADEEESVAVDARLRAYPDETGTREPLHLTADSRIDLSVLPLGDGLTLARKR